MVGFNSAFKNTHQASKLSDQTDPIELSIPEFADLPVSLLDQLPDFDFVDDWIVDNDSVNMSIEENLAVNGTELKKTDFDSSPSFAGERVGGEVSLGSLIEEEMGKVSLVGASESSNLIGVGVNEVPLVVDFVKYEVPFSYEVLGELKSKENGDEVKVEDNDGDGENGLALVTNTVKANIITALNKAESTKLESDGEESSSCDSESESESDSSTSSSSSSSSSEDEKDKKKEMEEAVEVEEGEIKDFDAEEILFGSDEDEPAVKGPIKSKNEIEFLPPVPPIDVTLEPHHQTLSVGVILSMMDTKVVVEGREQHNPLNEGSILWITETRSPLGLVDEIFGPVKNPFYIVRYNSDQEVPPGICEGTPVSFVADFADHVLNDKNLYRKGYDASGENDEEISDEVEFSDDEKEAEYRRAQKMANKGANDRKRGNQEVVARKKVQHKGPWKNSQPPAQAFEGHTGQASSPNQFQAVKNTGLANSPSQFQAVKHTGQANSLNQLHIPPVEASFGCGSCACSFSTGPASAGVPPSGPSASQVAHANCSTPQNLVPAAGGWANGMTGQTQQHMVFPNGFPINGMPIQQLNHYHQPPQMLNGFPNGMLFQQQFDPSQRLMHNAALPYGQPNFPPGPSTPWQGHLGQLGFNQAQFGMGLQGHLVNTPINAGNQQGMSNVSYNEQSNEMLPPSNMQGNFSAHQHNQGRTSTRGRRPYGRGGHFSGRRGRQ